MKNVMGNQKQYLEILLRRQNEREEKGIFLFLIADSIYALVTRNLFSN
jgi:hypothetical protein